MVINWKPSIPRWKQLYEILLQRISDGVYPPGQRIPSINDLVIETGLAVGTVSKALQRLRDEGMIITEPGLGSSVPEQLDPEETPHPSS